MNRSLFSQSYQGSLLGQAQGRAAGTGPTLFSFGFSVAGEKQIATKFSFIADRSTNFQPLFASDEFRQVFLDAEREQFGTEGQSGSDSAGRLNKVASGGKWAALSTEYAAWKRLHYPGAPILFRTGTLWRSLVQPGAPGQVYAPSQRSVTFGTTVKYAIYHQAGTRMMPQRRPVQLGRKQLDKFRRLIMKWLISTGQDYRGKGKNL